MSKALQERAHILIVDDDPALGRVLKALLKQDGLEASHVLSGPKALALLEKRPFEMVISDLRMPEMDGISLLRELSARWPELPVVMLTAHGTVPLAVEAMKEGAREFVLKPFEREELIYVIRSQLDQSSSHKDAPSALGSDALIGTSKAMGEVRSLIAKAARTDASILLRGESGTGKELVAKAIHEQSERSSEPLISVHCGALPDSLIESELFGYEKGAFTGALRRKPGRVELAEKGTLFLDEIGDTSPLVQVKLLRLLQERSFERLGGRESISADVRFIAATHRDLDTMVAHDDFRADLFYRLNVVPIWLPPLRERDEDIALLSEHFVTTLGATKGQKNAELTSEAISRLQKHRWPGNVRELQNLIERLIVLSDHARIGLADVERELSHAPSVPSSAQDDSLDARRRDAERKALEETLARCNNNRTQAARVLGVSRRTLYNKLEAYGLI